MKVLLKFYSRRFIYALAFILSTQGAISELNAIDTSAHQTIENFEAELMVDQLLLLMQKRLVIMHEVSRTKWNQGLAIEDKIREQQILTNLTKNASQHGLDEKWVIKFFQAQIDASKEIQKQDFILWQQEGMSKFEGVFSLNDELRSYIDHLNNEIILTLSRIRTQNSHINRKYILDTPISIRASDHIENDIWSLAIAPLKLME
jgi:chorismate mutase-like protein